MRIIIFVIYVCSFLLIGMYVVCVSIVFVCIWLVFIYLFIGMYVHLQIRPSIYLATYPICFVCLVATHPCRAHYETQHCSCYRKAMTEYIAEVEAQTEKFGITPP